MDYGLRILLTLGCNPDRRMTSEDLAAEISVPRQFTLKIAQLLTKAGLVKAQRGVGGGMQLARPTEAITLLEVFNISDTPRAINECLINPAFCTRTAFCSTHNELRTIQSRLEQDLKQITLAELIKRQIELNAKRAATPESGPAS